MGSDVGQEQDDSEVETILGNRVPPTPIGRDTMQQRGRSSRFLPTRGGQESRQPKEKPPTKTMAADLVR